MYNLRGAAQCVVQAELRLLLCRQAGKLPLYCLQDSDGSQVGLQYYVQLSGGKQRLLGFFVGHSFFIQKLKPKSFLIFFKNVCLLCSATEQFLSSKSKVFNSGRFGDKDKKEISEEGEITL